MLEKLSSYFNIGDKIYGVELFTWGQETIYQVVLVRRVKNELFISDENRFSNWETFIASLDKRIPVCLTINSNQVLERVLKYSDQVKTEALLDRAFPSLDFSRFYFNSTSFRNHFYISIKEKIATDKILEEFKKTGVHILRFHLGLSPLSWSMPHIKENIVHTSNKSITFSDDQDSASIDDLKILDSGTTRMKSAYSMNGIQISNESLLSFSSVLPLFFEASTFQTNCQDDVLKLETDFKYTRYLRVLWWPSILTILSLLLINFIIYSFYFDKVQELNQEANLNSIEKEKLSNLEALVLGKEKKVDAILSNTNSSVTFFLDHIAKDVPASILLDELNYQPITKPLRESKPIEQNFGAISVKGETTNTEEFSKWIERIENYDWVNLVETLGYGYKSKTSSSFVLNIKINGE